MLLASGLGCSTRLASLWLKHQGPLGRDSQTQTEASELLLPCLELP